jgi:hypothetical protein
MKLVNDGKEWSIQGQGSERARIAYATEEDGRLVFKFELEAGAKPGLKPQFVEQPEGAEIYAREV